MIKALHKDNRGFTLIELLIVIAILGILAAIAIPMLMGQRGKAVITEAETNLQILSTVNEQFYAENARYSPTGTTDWIDYKADGSGLEGELRGFRPGALEDLNFTYSLIIEETDGPGQGFVAKATGKAGSPAEGLFRSLDNNGNWAIE